LQPRPRAPTARRSACPDHRRSKGPPQAVHRRDDRRDQSVATREIPRMQSLVPARSDRPPADLGSLPSVPARRSADGRVSAAPGNPRPDRATWARWFADWQSSVRERATRSAPTDVVGAQLDRDQLSVVAALGHEDRVEPASSRDALTPRGPMDVSDQPAWIATVEDRAGPRSAE